MCTQPARHWLDMFWKEGVASGPIASIDQVFNDPQVPLAVSVCLCICAVRF